MLEKSSLPLIFLYWLDFTHQFFNSYILPHSSDFEYRDSYQTFLHPSCKLKLTPLSLSEVPSGPSTIIRFYSFRIQPASSEVHYKPSVKALVGICNGFNNIISNFWKYLVIKLFALTSPPITMAFLTIELYDKLILLAQKNILITSTLLLSACWLCWHVWTFQITPFLRPDEPKKLPYWIPCK